MKLHRLRELWMATCKKSNRNNSWLQTLEEKKSTIFSVSFPTQRIYTPQPELSQHIHGVFVSLTSFSSKGKRPLSSKSLIFWEISIRILNCSDKQQLSYYTPEIWPVFVPLHRQRCRGLVLWQGSMLVHWWKMYRLSNGNSGYHLLVILNFRGVIWVLDSRKWYRLDMAGPLQQLLSVVSYLSHQDSHSVAAFQFQPSSNQLLMKSWRSADISIWRFWVSKNSSPISCQGSEEILRHCNTWSCQTGIETHVFAHIQAQLASLLKLYACNWRSFSCQNNSPSIL